MAFSFIEIEHPESEYDIERLLTADNSSNRAQAGRKLMAYIRSLMGGARRAALIIGAYAVKATGTLTGTSVIATDAVTIAGVTLTCVASGATEDQFNIGADDDETMENLAAAINAHSDLSGIVTADTAANVVTVSAAKPGLIGNGLAISSADATIVASGTHLTGGTDGTTNQTHNFGSQGA